MGLSDDIAEKVVDLLLDPTLKAAIVGIDTGKDAAVHIYKGADAALKKAMADAKEREEKEKKDRRLADLKGEISPVLMADLSRKLAMSTDCVTVVDSDCQEFEDYLKSHDILYAKMNVKDDNSYLFTFLSSDSVKIEAIENLMKAGRGELTEVRPDMYMNHLAPGTVRIVEGIGSVEMELLRHYAQKDKFVFTVIDRGDSGKTLVFDVKDEPKARKALLHTGWDLTGANGARNRQQVAYRLKGREAIRMAVEDAERELYIVNKLHPSDYIRISEQDFTTFKNGAPISSVPRGTPGFLDKCMIAAHSMEGAVLLDGDDYHPDLTPADLADRWTLDLFDRHYEDLREINRQNGLIALVAQKYGLDNENNATWGLWDPSVSYSEFANYEFIMDDEEREARKWEFEHFKKAAFYTQDNYIVQDIRLEENNRNIDFLIQKADEKRRQQGEPTPRKDRDRDRDSD